MWASLSGVTDETQPKPTTDDKPVPQESTANLNAALLSCVGEEAHQGLRQNCALLIRKELPVDEFHTSCLALFQNKDGGMNLYRRLVLSLPDGDKSAMLLSLVDEAVAIAKKEQEIVPTITKSEEETTPSNPVVKNDAKDSDSDPVAKPPNSSEANVATDDKSSPEGKGAEEQVEAVTDPNLLIQEKKQAVQSKEKAILSVMAKRQADLAKEKQALDMIRTEMAALSRQQSNEITELMTKLGETDKDLWYLERDFKAAETEYLKCKARYEKMNLAKTNMVAQLTSLTLNAERRKEEKLNTIMEKLKNDGVVFPGAALAALT